MKMTIGKKFSLIVIATTLLIGISIVVNWHYGQKVETLAEFSRTESAVYALKAKDMQIAIIQVQQWLTDISATRGGEGFDDGFQEAEDQAAVFKRLYKEFHAMFTRENDSQAVAQLEALNKNFDAFYAMGNKMAAVYIKKGPSEGNKSMEEFDPFAAAITSDLDMLVKSQVAELGVSMETISSTVRKSRNINLVVSIILLVVIATLIYFITAGIRENVSNIVNSVDSMAKGNFTTTIDIKSRDEMGQIGNQLEAMQLQITTMLKDIIAGNDTLSSSATELSSISQQMYSNAGQTASQAETVAAGAEELSVNANSVAAAMEQAATNVGMVTSAADQMAATIDEIAQNTEKARAITAGAVSQAEDASGQVGELGQAADAIGKVVETITEISEQVNLLALNATIEAARAGEAGKGLPWWPTRSRSWPGRRPRPPARSRPASRGSRPAPTAPSRVSAAFRAWWARSTRSWPPLPRRWRSSR